LLEEHKKKLGISHAGGIPWNKGSAMKQETKNKISIANKGKHRSEEIRQKMSRMRMGKKLSEETKRKIGKSNAISQLGNHHSEETKKRISLAHKGKRPWNYNLNKDTDVRIKKWVENKERIKKISLANKGRDCYWLKGKSRTKEVRKKISEGHIGKKLSEETKQKIRLFNLGRSPSEDTRKRLSIAVSGDKSYRWQGGKSFEPYSKEFNNFLKTQIRKRDNYQCRECLKFQNDLRTNTNRIYKLIIHHIDFNKKNNNQNNLISLCRPCHSKTNYNREKWILYYKNKMEVENAGG